MASPPLACPRAFGGHRLEPNATLAYRRLPTCGDRPGYTCCGPAQEAAIARADAACRADARAGCCDALRPLRCFACDGAAQLGIVTGAAPQLCAIALAACGDDDVSVDALGRASLCGADALLCSPAREVFPWGEEGGGGGGGGDSNTDAARTSAGVAFCQALGFPVLAQHGGGWSTTSGGDGGDAVGDTWRLPALEDATDAGVDTSPSHGSGGSGHAFAELAGARARGYTGFPTALDAATTAALERAIARAAREREAAASEAAAAAAADAAAAASAFSRRFSAASGEPLAAILLGALAILLLAYRRQVNAWVRRAVLGRGGSKPRLSTADLRAARLAFQRAKEGPPAGGGSGAPAVASTSGPALRAPPSGAPDDASDDDDEGKES